MASGDDVEEREFRSFQGSQASEALKRRTYCVAEKNMREVSSQQSETTVVQEEDVSRAGECREPAEGL